MFCPSTAQTLPRLNYILTFLFRSCSIGYYSLLPLLSFHLDKIIAIVLNFYVLSGQVRAILSSNTKSRLFFKASRLVCCTPYVSLYILKTVHSQCLWLSMFWNFLVQLKEKPREDVIRERAELQRKVAELQLALQQERRVKKILCSETYFYKYFTLITVSNHCTIF